MFGRKAPRDPTPTVNRSTGVTSARVAVANDDGRARGVIAALIGVIGAGIQGGSGLVYGYERGAPEVTVTGYINQKTPAPVSLAFAKAPQMGTAYEPVPQYADGDGTTPLDPMNSLYWFRSGM